MWKRLLIWAASLCLGLFSLWEGYWLFGLIMLAISVGSVFLWIFKLFRERNDFKQNFKISSKDLVCLAAALGFFVISSHFCVPWISWCALAIIVGIKIFFVSRS